MEGLGGEQPPNPYFSYIPEILGEAHEGTPY